MGISTEQRACIAGMLNERSQDSGRTQHHTLSGQQLICRAEGPECAVTHAGPLSMSNDKRSTVAHSLAADTASENGTLKKKKGSIPTADLSRLSTPT